MNTRANRMPITSAYAAKINQMSGHSRLTSLPSAYTENASTTAPLAYPPMMAPNPLVIIKNNPVSYTHLRAHETKANRPRKRSPYVLVICNAAPKSMENRKKIAIFFLLNNTNASSPKEESNVFFSVLAGLHAGRVKEYKPSKSADAPPT